MSEFLPEFLLLGPLVVLRDGEPVPVRGERQRALLASLLLNAGRPVAADVLIECIWGSEPAASAGHSLHELVSQLRRTLAVHELGDLIETSGPGTYVAGADAEQIDADRFAALAATGLGLSEPGERARALRTALDLWRGPALADVVLHGQASDERERLDELRLAATGEWVDAEMLLGHHATLIAELERLTGSYPLHERFRAQLMLALYREGRQADALSEYQETRALLADELGLQPSQPLRDLQRAILRQDPALAWATQRAPGVPPNGSRSRRRRYWLVAGAALAAAAISALLGLGTRAAGSAVLFDSLHGSKIDSLVWDYSTVGNGLAVSPTSSGVRLTVTADASPADSSGVMKARLTTYCWLAGPFDVQVDYRLSTWPRANGVSVGMYAAYGDLVRESDVHHGEQYVGNVAHSEPPDRAPNRRLSTQDGSGTLRIIRSDNRLEEQVRTGGKWRFVYAKGAPFGFPAAVYLEAWTNGARFGHRQVDVEFSNFRVNTGCSPARWAHPPAAARVTPRPRTSRSPLRR